MTIVNPHRHTFCLLIYSALDTDRTQFRSLHFLDELVLINRRTSPVKSVRELERLGSQAPLCKSIGTMRRTRSIHQEDEQSPGYVLRESSSD